MIALTKTSMNNVEEFQLEMQGAGEWEDGMIVSFSSPIPSSLTPVSLNRSEEDSQIEASVERQKYYIRLANTPERRESANVLIDRMYAWRGYKQGNLKEDPHRITLVSYDMNHELVGTITIGMEDRLLADENYHQELDILRSNGRKVCEYNGLAIASTVKNKRVIASLFHIAILYPWGIFGFTDGVIEVTPRHAKFYQTMMGFTLIGEERICPRVNVPGVLLRLDFSFSDLMITKVGGLMDKGKSERSFYPYFFTKTDADGILGRLKRMM